MSAVTDEVQKAPYAAQAKWRERNPKAVWAQAALRAAIKRGIVEPQPCVVCGDPKAEGHHRDYDKPAEVVWLCRRHHRAEHRAMRAETC
jgi:hypothetical protein